MKAIDEAKVNEIIAELRHKRGMLRNIRDNRHRDENRQGIQEEIDDISSLITALEQLADIPDDAWTLDVGGDNHDRY